MGKSISFLTMLGLLFIGLKLGSVIDWHWFWVLWPIWIPFALVFAILLFIVLVLFIVALVAVLIDKFT